MKRLLICSLAVIAGISVARSEMVYLEDEFLVESSQIQDEARIAFSNSKTAPGGTGDVIICPGTGFTCLIKTTRVDAEGNPMYISGLKGKGMPNILFEFHT